MDKILLTFDIDGTLMNCKGCHAIQQEAFMNAFKHFFNRPVNEHNLWGKLWVGITDGAIATGIIEKHHTYVSPRAVEKFLSYYDEEYVSLCGALKPVLTPGIRETIEEVKKMDDVVISVATGNTRKIAEIKLAKAGLKHFFKPLIGGFGENMYRYQCINEARQVAENLMCCKFKGSIHIGDSNDDVSSALKADSFPIGVLTGSKKNKCRPGKKYFIKNLEEQRDYLFEHIDRIRHMKKESLLSFNE